MRFLAIIPMGDRTQMKICDSVQEGESFIKAAQFYIKHRFQMAPPPGYILPFEHAIEIK